MYTIYKIKDFHVDWLDGILDAEENRIPRTVGLSKIELLNGPMEYKMYWIGYESFCEKVAHINEPDSIIALDIRRKQRS